MKKYLLLLVLAVISVSSNAQTVIFSDDFESYSPDTLLEPQTSKWNGWYNALTNSTVSTDTSVSGIKSVKVYDGVVTGASQQSDVVAEFGNISSGIYELTFYQYVPRNNGTSKAGGYFNLLHAYNAAAQSASWAIEVSIYADNAVNQGAIQSNGTYTYFTPKYDQWVKYRFVIDIDNDLAEMYYDTAFVHSWQWSTMASGGATTSNVLAAIDLYATCGNPASTGCLPLAYFDDIVLTQRPAFARNFNLESPANNTRLEIANDPSVLVVAKWESTATLSGNQVEYEFLIDRVGGDFSNPLFSSVSNSTGYDTTISFFMLQLAQVASQSLGLNVGDSSNFIWTVKASDGTNELLALNPRTIKLVRGAFVGIDEVLLNKSVTVSPNPANDVAYLNFDLPTRAPVRYEMYNALGEKVMEYNFGKISKLTHAVDVSTFAKGMYLIKVYSDNAVITKSFIKE